MLWKPTWIFQEEHTQPQHAARQLAAGEAGRAAAASVGAADSEVRGLAAWREIGVEVSDGGILIPPPNLREILSMRMNWFQDHLKGEKQYWKNKDGEPLQVTISSMWSSDLQVIPISRKSRRMSFVKTQQRPWIFCWRWNRSRTRSWSSVSTMVKIKS